MCITNYIFVTGSAESHYGEGVVSAALAISGIDNVATAVIVVIILFFMV